MVYFPTEEERTYTCQGCGKTFIQGNTACLVAHANGTCCHVGDIEIAGKRLGSDKLDTFIEDLRRI